MTAVKKLLLLLAVSACASMAAPCHAASLRGEVLLDKDTLTLGDIFGDVGEAGSKILGPAPAPGQKLSYDVPALLQLAKSYGIAWQPASNYDKVDITRASQVINAAMIKEHVAAAIGANTSEKDLDIALDNANLEIHRPTSEELDWRVADLSYDPSKHRFTGTLIVESGTKGATASVIPIAGRAMPMVQVAILNRALPPGSRIGAEVVDWDHLAIDKAGADAITSPDQLKGVESRRALEAKSILRLRDTTSARLITKGSMVSMQVNTPGMQITAQGRALADAVIGETVRVMNTQSNRAVDAVVIGEGKVSVTPVNTSTNHVASVE